MTTLEKATDYLKEHFQCKTIILYGSRARGDFSQESDWDLFGIGNQDLPYDSFQINGEWIDISISKCPTPEKLLRLKNAKIIYDTDQIGFNLLKEVEWIIEKGPEINRDQLNHNKNWTQKMLKRITKNDLEGNYRKHWLLFQLLEDYFLYRGLWYFGSKESLKYLKENDSKVCELYENALKSNATYDDINKLAQIIMRA